jgi:hypothetical protein
MDEYHNRQSNLVETTDCLEAVGVLRGWKNFLFIIVAVCLLVQQASFWLVNMDYIKPNGQSTSSLSIEAAQDTKLIGKAQAEPVPEQKHPAPGESTAEQQVQKPPEKAGTFFGITFEYLAWALRLVNGVLILAATLFMLTVLFSLKISLIGRLGGINHITRAFFLSLVMLVLLLPWQMLFGPIVVGAMYSPDELTNWCAVKPEGIFGNVVHYLRFTGYWLLIVLLFALSQLRSSRWAKAILRRLEVV